MRSLTLMLVTLLAGAALAGCAEEPGDGTDTAYSTDGDGGSPGSGADGADLSHTGEAPATGERCESTLDASRSAAFPTWVLETSKGTIRVTLFCDKAPVSAQNFVNLTEQGYFDGQKFHRVIKDFMNQGGDPNSKDEVEQPSRPWGVGGPGYTIADEFWCADGRTTNAYPADCELGLKHDSPGVLSMANTGRARTGGSQFFLTAVATPWLDGKHAVFGHTADQESTDVVLAINGVCPCPRDRPDPPVVIEKATIEWE